MRIRRCLPVVASFIGCSLVGQSSTVAVNINGLELVKPDKVSDFAWEKVVKELMGLINRKKIKATVYFSKNDIPYLLNGQVMSKNIIKKIEFTFGSEFNLVTFVFDHIGPGIVTISHRGRCKNKGHKDDWSVCNDRFRCRLYPKDEIKDCRKFGFVFDVSPGVITGFSHCAMCDDLTDDKTILRACHELACNIIMGRSFGKCYSVVADMGFTSIEERLKKNVKDPKELEDWLSTVKLAPQVKEAVNYLVKNGNLFDGIEVVHTEVVTKMETSNF